MDVKQVALSPLGCKADRYLTNTSLHQPFGTWAIGLPMVGYISKLEEDGLARGRPELTTPTSTFKLTWVDGQK